MHVRRRILIPFAALSVSLSPVAFGQGVETVTSGVNVKDSAADASASPGVLTAPSTATAAATSETATSAAATSAVATSAVATSSAATPVAQATTSSTPAPPTSSEFVPPPFHISGKRSHAIQKYVGLTWLTQESLDLGGTLAAKVILGGHPRIKVKTYSFTDCLAGKFSSVAVDLKDCSFRKIPLANLSLHTSTPLQFRLFKSSKGPSGVAAPVMVAVSGELDEADVSRALRSPQISSELAFLHLELPGLGDQHLQVLEPKVTLEGGKVKINTWLITAGAPKDTGITMDITATPLLDQERFIRLKDTQVRSTDIEDPEQFSKFSQDLLNPLIDFGKFDRKTHAFRMTKFNLGEKKVEFAGKLLLVPKPVQAAEVPPKLSEK